MRRYRRWRTEQQAPFVALGPRTLLCTSRSDASVSASPGSKVYCVGDKAIRMSRVAMVFQQFALLPWRTVAENAGFGLELAGVPEAERKLRVQKQLELVGLAPWAGKYSAYLLSFASRHQSGSVWLTVVVAHILPLLSIIGLWGSDTPA